MTNFNPDTIGKFRLDDKVYVIQYLKDLKSVDPCEICEGTKEVVLKGFKYKCPSCFGKGTKNIYKRAWTLVLNSVEDPKLHKIYSKNISLRLSEPDTPKVSYTLEVHTCIGGVVQDRLKNISESSLFKTIEEAQAECDKRNKAIESKKL